jgi:hypothetical protein
MYLGPFGHIAWSETAHGSQPLEDQRHETLRALAHHLDETAQGALEGAVDDARHGTSSEASFVASIRSFARRVHDFRAVIDSHETSGSDLPGRLDELTTFARELSDRIRSAGALENTFDDWEAILDVLGRMRVLLTGGNVEVPAAHVVAALSGASLQEFRQLAHDLDMSATRAHASAKRDRRNYPDRGDQFLGELNHFAVRSRDLRSRADAGQVNPQQIGPVVDVVLEDARQADRRMRDARVFTSVWDDSGRTIIILQRMASLVRS